MGTDTENKPGDYLDFLLNESPEQWPEQWRRDMPPLPDSINPEIENSILSAIRSELDSGEIPAPPESLPEVEPITVSPANKYARWGALAAIIPVVIGVYIWLAPGPSEQLAPIALGAKDSHVIRVNSQERLPIQKGTDFNQGDVVEVAAKSRLHFQFGDDYKFRLDGPARLEFKGINSPSGESSGGNPGLELTVHSGRINILSKSAEQIPDNVKKSIIWRTQNAEYAMLGTLARLTVFKDSEVLDVNTGAFQVRKPGSDKSRDVKAAQSIALTGKALTDPKTKLPEPAAISKKADAALKTLKENSEQNKLETEDRTDWPTKDKPAGPQVKKDDGVRITGGARSRKQLEAKYGRVQIITLNNGRRFTGKLIKRSRSSESKIDSTRGMVTVPPGLCCRSVREAD